MHLLYRSHLYLNQSITFMNGWFNVHSRPLELADWLTEQMEQKATNQRKYVADSIVSDITYVLKLRSQETSYLKQRPVGCFLSFIFRRSISLHQIL